MAVKYKSTIIGWNPHTRDNPVYTVEFDDINYSGDPIEVKAGAGGFSIDFENNELSSFPAVVPSYLNIDLIVEEGLNLIDIFTENESNIKATIYKNEAVFGKYLLIPGNTKEPFIDPPYNMKLRAVDGLALLNKFKYTNISGQASVLRVISRCLAKIGLNLNINTFSSIQYQGMTVGGDVFAETIINQERFEGMDCAQVLEELMREWVAGLFQVNGEWFLIRYPDYLKTLGFVTFHSYDWELNSLSPITVNPDLILGTKTGDLIHVNTDQMRTVQLPYKQVTIRYEYGLFKNLLSPATANFTGFLFDFFGWQKVGGINATPKDTKEYAEIIGRFDDFSQFISLPSAIPVGEALQMQLNLTWNGVGANGVLFHIIYTNGPQTLWFYSEAGEWQNTEISSGFIDERAWDDKTVGNGNIVNSTLTIPMPLDNNDDPIPGGFINIKIFPAWFKSSNILTAHPGSLRLYDIKLHESHSDGRVLAERHEVVNNGDFTQVPDMIEVSTGESQFSGYLGTMFKADGSTPTNGFSDDGGLNFEPFLTLAAKDILFQHGKSMSRYEGSVMGEFNLLSRITINNLFGIFMPLSLRHNLASSVTESALIETNIVDVPHTVLPIQLEYDR